MSGVDSVGVTEATVTVAGKPSPVIHAGRRWSVVTDRRHYRASLSGWADNPVKNPAVITADIMRRRDY
ncbi:hypothetical protein [Candidatus Spongiihabitans sp.]|uniref:hypothetical protein n=1 Tax=Candidatus Spongiihabitans sp. TaxID=3101308 RepID=UPI003C799988